MAEITINAKKRESSTKGTLNQMRNNSIVPGVFYTKGSDSIPIEIEEGFINKVVFTQETIIVNLKIDENEPVKCVIKDVQFDPLSDRVIHFDLFGVTIGQELELQVPIQYIGQAKGVKSGGVLQEFLHKLDIACLPRHIPDHVTIDISNLDVGNAVHIKDLSFENVKILNPDEVIVVSVTKSRAADLPEDKEEAEMEEEISEPEVIGKGKSEEEE